MNATIERFGYPGTLIHEWSHWVALIRLAQPTLGSLVLAAKSDAMAFGDLPPAAHVELTVITKSLEAALARVVSYDKLNYLMLMMVDPHVHFHVIPRYDGERTLGNLILSDEGWPGVPLLGQATQLTDAEAATLVMVMKAALEEQ
ncbi:HIT family protein [Sphingomonas faeni]|uniref:HIT family protein n=1 Tax=Sphingomonas faeni TaxID=185950 RepID=UPI00278AF066|nr:HIT family protein [Sphingomonas faeni]MDQ0839951.1 diadenosine tetraphosphate (Ap4A) HIT family hydrolase [Sphingomonas faeni]